MSPEDPNFWNGTPDTYDGDQPARNLACSIVFFGPATIAGESLVPTTGPPGDSSLELLPRDPPELQELEYEVMAYRNAVRVLGS